MNNNDKTKGLFTKPDPEFSLNVPNNFPAAAASAQQDTAVTPRIFTPSGHATRCMGCMEEFRSEFELCPHCGYIVGTKPRLKCYLSPGLILSGRYILGRVIGQGGFGITYIGYDTRESRKVAIKEFFPNALSTREAGNTHIECVSKKAEEHFQSGVKKMLDEGERLSRFRSNPNIVDVYDAFEENGTAYIVMEYLDGKSLKEYAAENGGKLPPEQAVSLMLPIINALEEMHRENMIHRDIAPDNIYICNNGSLKLLDFGSARIAVEDAEKSLSVLVKPGYAPKEQYASRSKQGPWTDVYSACATLYKLITGEAPVESIERENTPLKAFESFGIIGYDYLENILEMGLEPEVQNRTRTAKALSTMLSNPLAIQKSAVPRAPKPVAAQAKPAEPIRPAAPVKAPEPVTPVKAPEQPAPVMAPEPPIQTDEPQKKKKKKWPIVLVILLLLFVVFAAVAGIFIYYWYQNQMPEPNFYDSEFTLEIGEKIYEHDSTGNVSFRLDVPEDGIYVFESLNYSKWNEDLKATLKVHNQTEAENDNTDSGKDFRIEHNLEAGDVVWLNVSNSDGTNYIDKICLKVYTVDTPSDAQTDGNYVLTEGETSYPHNSTAQAIFTFTAKNGSYAVESKNGVHGTEDLYATLYINGEYVKSDDESGNADGDFYLFFECKEGDSVELKVNTYRSEDSIDTIYLSTVFTVAQLPLEERVFNYYSSNKVYIMANEYVYPDAAYSSDERFWETSAFRSITDYELVDGVMWLKIETSSSVVWYPIELTGTFEIYFENYEKTLEDGISFTEADSLYSPEPTYSSQSYSWNNSGVKYPCNFTVINDVAWYCFEATDESGNPFFLWYPAE